MNWYPWIVLAHVLGAFVFVLAHGASVFASFRARSNPTRENVTACLELSGMSLGLMYPALLVLLLAGIAAGFIGGWWAHLWIWVSLAILVVLLAVMYAYGSTYYMSVRKALGIGSNPLPEGGPPSDEELATILASPRPEILAAVGGIGLVAIITLMVLKPF
jgi:hypothetical protein